MWISVRVRNSWELQSCGRHRGFPGGTSDKNPPANARGARHVGMIPGSGRSHGGGHGNPLQYSCLENPMDSGAWQTTIHRVAQSGTKLKRLCKYSWEAYTYRLFLGNFTRFSQ